MDNKLETKNIYAAILEFQKKIAEASIKQTGENKHINSRYATLSDIMETIRPILNECGLFICHVPRVEADHVYVKTKVIHAASGEEIETDVVIPAKGNAHAVASGITYGRRYGINSLLALVADTDDDDGNKANESTKNSKSAPAQKPAQTYTEIPEEIKDALRQICKTKKEVDSITAGRSNAEIMAIVETVNQTLANLPDDTKGGAEGVMSPYALYLIAVKAKGDVNEVNIAVELAKAEAGK